jgi:hypothetical protein
MKGDGWLFRSDNLLTERDAKKLRWEMLPPGKVGIRNEDLGDLQQEHVTVPLPDGGIYCTFRTLTGYVGHATSRDGGRTWPAVGFATFARGGRRIKHPRACARVVRFANGKFLLWFHNHDARDTAPARNKHRNPAWISGGVLHDGVIRWSEPEILLYGFSFPFNAGMSYPDFIEEDGRYWVTETQKTTARIHEIDADLLEAVWNQSTAKAVPTKGLLLERAGDEAAGTTDLKGLPPAAGKGFTLDVAFTLNNLKAGQFLLDNRDPEGRGLVLDTAADGTVQLTMNDGRGRPVVWGCDTGLLKAGSKHHVTFIVDGGPRIILAVVDGRLCDGGTQREAGWTWFHRSLGDVGGNGRLRIGAQLDGRLHAVRVYDRPLRVSEAVGIWRAGQ